VLHSDLRTHRLFRQIIRFGITGSLLTSLTSGGYWAMAELANIDPNLSLAIAFTLTSALGFIIHSRWSFADQLRVENTSVRISKFFITNAIGFLSNQFLVWLFVKQLEGETWWAIPPMIIVTPVLTFILHRKWVFG
jgi:putative flippase GtrA